MRSDPKPDSQGPWLVAHGATQVQEDRCGALGTSSLTVRTPPFLRRTRPQVNTAQPPEAEAAVAGLTCLS